MEYPYNAWKGPSAIMCGRKWHELHRDGILEKLNLNGWQRKIGSNILRSERNGKIVLENLTAQHYNEKDALSDDSPNQVENARMRSDLFRGN
ncbi:MAG TPA: hypothetical protein IAB50_10300 [Candidatus Faecivicinus avistercoris]|nr:hypothetical protein [Candidatus Faecivicinus avistercoris]